MKNKNFIFTINKIHYLKLFNVILIILLAIILINSNREAVYALEDTDGINTEVSLTAEECSALPLAEYMNAIIEAKEKGIIPDNVKLLSPAFNFTNGETVNIINEMASDGAKFSSLDGIALNVYNTGSDLLSNHLQTQGLQDFINKYNLEVHITETGNMPDFDGGSNDVVKLVDQLKIVLDNPVYGDNVKRICLFNPTETNSQFNYHSFSAGELQYIIDQLGQDKICYNTGNFFGDNSSGNVEGAPTPINLLQIAKYITDSNNNLNTTTITNTINSTVGNTYIRIGVGDDPTGFSNVNDYIDFLSQVGNASPSETIYAIAGPNEPDLELWLMQWCQQYKAGAIPQCVGPYDYDPTWYDTEVVGSENSGVLPFKILGNIDSKWVDDIDELPNAINATFEVTINNHIYPDHELMASQRIGVISEGDYGIQDRIDNLAYPLQFSMQIHTQPFYESFKDRTRQEFMKDSETPVYYTQRIIPGDGTNIGTKSEIPVSLIGCVQRPYCNPNEKIGDDDYRFCLKKDIVDYTDCGPEYVNCKCNPGDNPKDCISVGERFNFQGQIVLNEDPEPHSTSRIYKEAWRNISKLPHETDLELNSNYAYNNTDNIDAVPLYKTIEANNNTDIKLDVEENITEIKNQTIITKANAAETEPAPYQETEYCEGMALVIEDKGDTYAVKAWDTQPEGCDKHVDFGFRMSYYYDGEYLKTCEVTIHKSAGLPSYDPNGNDGEKYGESLSDYLTGEFGMDKNCAVPPEVDPSSGKKFEVAFEMTGSRAAYSDNPECVQKPYCTCPSDDIRCTTIGNSTVPPVDCRACETWANPSLCDEIISNDMLTQQLCTEGVCTTNLKTEQGYDYESYIDEVNQFIKRQFEFEFRIDLGNIPGLGWLWTDNELSWKCEVRKDCDKCGTPPFTYDCNCDEEYQCDWNKQEYLLYISPPYGIIGDLNIQRTDDMRTHNNMFQLPGVNDAWFIPDSAEGEFTYQLNYKDVDVSNESGLESGFNESDALELVGYNDESPGSRTVKVEYFDYYSQARMHCGGNMLLSIPVPNKEFPLRQYQLCNDFSFVTGSTAYNKESEKLAYERNRLYAKANNIQFASAYGLENPTETQYAIYNSDTEKIPKEIAYAIDKEISNSDVKTVYYLVDNSTMLPESKKYTQLTENEKTLILYGLTKDIETIFAAYGYIPNKYSTNETVSIEELPENIRKEINLLIEKYKIKYNNIT